MVQRVRRRPQSRDEGRAEVLARAATAIAQHGFHGMSMRALASATQRSLAGFYHLFESKEDILFALQRGAFETLIEGTERALGQVATPHARLHTFVRQHAEFCIAHPDVLRVLVHEAATLPPAHRAVMRDLKHKYFLLGRGVVADVMKRGEKSAQETGSKHEALDPAEVERVTYCMFGMLNWIYGWYEADRHGSAEDVTDTIVGLVMHGVEPALPKHKNGGRP
jgi:AcrR family transcriptional regulator